MVESSTMGDRDSGTPAAYAAGPATDVQLQRNGHAFNTFSEYQDIAAGFQTQLGFHPDFKYPQRHTHATYQWFPKHSWVQSYGLEENLNLAWDHAENRVYHYTTVDPFLLLPHNIVIAPLVGENSDTLGPQNGYGFESNHNFTENFAGFVFSWRAGAAA